jgi:predicted lipoprotein with Yx(FWY)xxD motif
MKLARFTILIALVAFALIALAACAPAPTPTPVPTPVPPTATRVPPTNTPVPPPPTAVPPTAVPATATSVPPTQPPAATATAVPPSPTPVTKPAVLALNDTKLGKIITDGNGMTLYMYPPDTRNPITSNCYDQCARAWPPLLTAGKPEVKGAGLDEKLIGTTTRKDGTVQVAYNGWPLYYWQRDRNPGDTLGQAVGDIWWVMTADGGTITSAANPTIELILGAGRDADQNGKARLVSKGDKTDVILDIKPGAAGAAQPAHIHEGTCPAPGAVKYPLTNVVDGKSTTTLDVKLADLLKGGIAINAHLSAAEAAKYVACGNMPAGAVITVGKGRDGDQAGIAVLVSQGAKTEVNMFLKPDPGIVQPAHIHEGACPVPGAVKFPLTNLTEGKSKTVVDAALADLLKGGLAINAHKSAAEAAKYVACGDLK